MKARKARELGIVAPRAKWLDEAARKTKHCVFEDRRRKEELSPKHGWKREALDQI